MPTTEKRYIAVISPQHGICLQGHTGPDSAREDSSWTDIYEGEAGLLCDHIQRAVEIAAAYPSAVLIFSGGDTRLGAPGRCEAESAFEIAKAHDWFGHPNVAERCLLESYARDSAENLLFSAVLYRRLTDEFPEKVIVVGWGFKAPRFAAHAIGLPFLGSGIEYIGVNNPPVKSFEAALRGELSKLQAITSDRDWLLRGSQWQSQRKQRDPFGTKHPYTEIQALGL